jgi:hypothetical protein
MSPERELTFDNSKEEIKLDVTATEVREEVTESRVKQLEIVSNCLCKSDIVQLKTIKNPSPNIKVLIQALLILFEKNDNNLNQLKMD